MSFDYKVTLEIPFETAEQSVIAKNVLSPDPILKAQDLTVDYTTKDNILVCDFQGISDRVLRVSISSVIDSIKTIVEAMDTLA